MSVQVVAAFVTGGAGLLVGATNGLVSWRQNRRIAELEFQKLELARVESAERARIDYEYQARKKLYEQWAPLFFQLSESARFALNRIGNLSNPAVWPRLAESEPGPPIRGRAVLPAAQYELVVTLYGLYTPLAYIRELSRRLTSVDLSLDPTIRLQYLLANAVYQVVQEDQVLAAAFPPLAYTPFADDWRMQREHRPEQYWWQGLTMGRLDSFLDLMASRDTSTSLWRPISFGEFERTYMETLNSADQQRLKVIATAANPLYQFRPRRRPVFCRILIVQARLYSALLRTGESSFVPPTNARDLFELLTIDESHLSWCPSKEDSLDLQDLVAATNNYLQDRVCARWRT